MIFVMEDKHEAKLNERFKPITSQKKIIVLGIPDEYKFMDPELIDILNISVAPYFSSK